MIQPSAAHGARGLLARPSGLLAGMRIRKKLIVLHTLFSLVLAGVLVGLLRPAIERIVEEAELHEVRLAVSLVRAKLQRDRMGLRTDGERAAIISDLQQAMPAGITLSIGQGERMGINSLLLERARKAPGELVIFRLADGQNAALVIDEQDGSAFVASAQLDSARASVTRLYILATVGLLLVYALIAAALELFVLPQHVYGPIRRMLEADAAVQSGDQRGELIAEADIPKDELGEIMRSRNEAVRALRRHEADLADALRRLEVLATDMQKKNHLLETAQKNLADADKLASLGILSAGLAHEMNTPLAVVKGLAEKLAREPGGHLSPSEGPLLLRVVGRLERLSESLLDFARVRPPSTTRVPLRPLIEEAWTLVRLDREAKAVECVNEVAPECEVICDADRMMQVLVNLLRNAVDAMSTAAARTPVNTPAAGASGRSDRESGVITVMAERISRQGRSWLAICILDNGPGLDPAIIPRLFEPFASTRLDARGTGLGLAVSQGIIREHNGLLTARNREDARGAVFEVLLPADDEHR